MHVPLLTEDDDVRLKQYSWSTPPSLCYHTGNKGFVSVSPQQKHERQEARTLETSSASMRKGWRHGKRNSPYLDANELNTYVSSSRALKTAGSFRWEKRGEWKLLDLMRNMETHLRRRYLQETNKYDAFWLLHVRFCATVFECWNSHK